MGDGGTGDCDGEGCGVRAEAGLLDGSEWARVTVGDGGLGSGLGWDGLRGLWAGTPWARLLLDWSRRA